MKKYRIALTAAFLAAALSFLPAHSALAFSESDAQAQVAAVGKETVSGNVLVWLLCAVAFLKVSQKIDSFMSSLGINVGHTGGSMIAEAMVAARGIGAARNLSSGHFSAGSGIPGRNGAGSPGRNGSAGNPGSPGGFMAGGLAGIVSRQAKNGAASAAVSQPDSGKKASPFAGSPAGGISGMVGRQIYASSVSKGGKFANDVIGNIATGSPSPGGVMTGEKAAEALQSYLGYAALEDGAQNVPSFSNVEIGGGRITGTEVSGEHPEGISFGMYHAAQYAAPEGSYTTVQAADGSSWYKQYAQDAVDKTPYMAADGSIAYKESIVKKMPPAPKRKDRM
ncbi:MAG: hypothetical protein NC331_06390 [Lachnospiraceae bacterium]|nr:hypothetical protein [Lachnospiraceae bacterium]MCM1238999.1 hypothetical protein [Lachnospiraceae bacterium]